MLREVAALLVDLDNTLLDDAYGTEKALQAACLFARQDGELDSELLKRDVRNLACMLWHGSPFYDYLQQIEITFMEGLCAINDGGGEATVRLRDWLNRYRLESWKGALWEQGVNDAVLAAKIAQKFLEQRRLFNQTFPGVEKTLRALKPHFCMAIVTNGASDLQRAKIAGAGLEPFFQAILVSGELGNGKPHPSLFNAALQQLDVPPSRAVMIGDNYERDILGAKEAGLKTIWIKRRGKRTGGNKERVVLEDGAGTAVTREQIGTAADFIIPGFDCLLLNLMSAK